MLKVFPVAGGARYSDDWGQPRGTPEKPRFHEGNDLLAPCGTPILAPDDGVVTYYSDPTGGPSFIMKFDDGSRSYGTHLQSYAFDVAVGSDTRSSPKRVDAGEVIGFVGHGGNAGTICHLHFQYWLPGGAIVDPYPYLRASEVRVAPKSSATTGFLPAFIAGAIILASAGAAAYIVRKKNARAVISRPVNVT